MQDDQQYGRQNGAQYGSRYGSQHGSQQGEFGQAPVRYPDRGDGQAPWSGPPSTKEIPFDHVVVLRLRGLAGNRVEETLSISVDGAFVATSIGYSFIPKPPTGGVINGQAVQLPPPWDALVGAAFNDPADAARCLFARFCGIDFTYSIVDSGSGRELQNRAIHNIAGLGSSDGARPFRPMAKPMLFLPRSTIRIVVDEVSEGPLFTDAQLFFVLHGYKMLGYLP